MPILINRYSERYESCDSEEDICEPDSCETLETDAPYTFRELVELLHNLDCEPSGYPATGDTREWISHYDTNNGTRDYYETGARENESTHYARSNPPRNAKYWRWAFIAAGIIR